MQELSNGIFVPAPPTGQHEWRVFGTLCFHNTYITGVTSEGHHVQGRYCCTTNMIIMRAYHGIFRYHEYRASFVNNNEIAGAQQYKSVVTLFHVILAPEEGARSPF